MISIKFLLVTSMLCKTEWSYENCWHDHTRWICLIFYQLLPTTSVGNKWGQQTRIQVLILGFKGLTSVLGPTGWWMVLPCTSLQRRKEVLAGKFQINHCFAGVVRGSPSDHLYTVYPSTPAPQHRINCNKCTLNVIMHLIVGQRLPNTKA